MSRARSEARADHRARWSRAVCLLAITLCLPHLGCGRKAAPRPPEDVLPRPVADLQAVSGAEGIQLSWSRPVLYADGSRMLDLAGFDIERAVGTEPRAPFTPLTSLTVDDRDRFRQVKRFQHLDRDTQPGTTYRYRVVTYTLDRYFSGPSNTVTVERTVPSEE